MIEEYDVVEASKNLNGKVLKGCKGTVLIVYSDFPSSFEVEFIDNNFKTIDVLTVMPDNIIKNLS